MATEQLAAVSTAAEHNVLIELWQQPWHASWECTWADCLPQPVAFDDLGTPSHTYRTAAFNDVLTEWTSIDFTHPDTTADYQAITGNTDSLPSVDFAARLTGSFQVRPMQWATSRAYMRPCLVLAPTRFTCHHAAFGSQATATGTHNFKLAALEAGRLLVDSAIVVESGRTERGSSGQRHLICKPLQEVRRRT